MILLASHQFLLLLVGHRERILQLVLLDVADEGHFFSFAVVGRPFLLILALLRHGLGQPLLLHFFLLLHSLLFRFEPGQLFLKLLLALHLSHISLPSVKVKIYLLWDRRPWF